MTELSKNAKVPQCDKTAVSSCVSDLPEIGKIYNCFDDGKINKSRLYTVEISEIIPFDKIDKETLKKMERASNPMSLVIRKRNRLFYQNY